MIITEAELQSIVDAHVAGTGAVGGVAAVLIGDEAIYAGAGTTRRGTEVPPGSDTSFRIGSVTKTFTATAVLRLWQDGALDLDDPLLSHVPEAKAIAGTAGDPADVTIRHLITHRSGLDSEVPLPCWETLRFPDEAELLAALGAASIAVAPGTMLKYSNLGYALLGVVIGRADGAPYNAFVAEEVLGPLGLRDTAFGLDEERARRAATGYDLTRRADSPTAAPVYDLGALAPAGGLYSTARDLVRWAAFHAGALDGTAMPLTPATLQAMHHPAFLAPDWSSGTCLGWGAMRTADVVVLAHEGGLHGFGAAVMVMPSRGAAVVALVNDSFTGGGALASGVLRALLAAEPGPSDNAIRPPAVDVDSVTAADAVAWEGAFVADSLPSMIEPVTVTAVGGHLVFELPSRAAAPTRVRVGRGAANDDLVVADGRWVGERVVPIESGERVDVFELGGFRFTRAGRHTGGARPFA